MWSVAASHATTKSMVTTCDADNIARLRQGGLWRNCTGRHGPKVRVHREADVDQGDEGRHHVANMDSLVVVALRDVQGWRRNSLLPAKAHVRAEHNHGCDVEQAPLQRLEDL
eukprot:CAMPEP_0115623782 /NCGR_PEP_ID=MMETSP0272-20121206/26953_1 /TAXON_ID=71861 /ORGANISM="Scrippsiella trochoidea, Strain CCMP3099" /LENGTH=111 /DNA_ID=CAMNT_0003060011 /DNA_START=110 /DNA_END=441 /DNA_ORIENTATION=+